MNDRDEAARPAPGTVGAARPVRLPVTIAFSEFRQLERAAPDRTPHAARFRPPGELLRGDVVFSGLRDMWAVVSHVTRSGSQVTVRVQEAVGSRTIACGARGPGFGLRADLRVDPPTIPDIPDGFPPRWGVWRDGVGPGSLVTLAWHPEADQAAGHARQASQDGREYVIELEVSEGWTLVDAYQHGRRSTWGRQLAAEHERLTAERGRNAVPPWSAGGKDGMAYLGPEQLAPPAGGSRDVILPGRSPGGKGDGTTRYGDPENAGPAQQAGQSFPRAPLVGPAAIGDRPAARPAGPGPSAKPLKP